MTISQLSRALLLAAAVAGPAAAAARGSAHVGFTYTQSDYWLVDQDHSRTPHLDLDLGLRLDGGLPSRDLVAYNVGVGWRAIRDEVNGVSTAAANNLTYDASALILNNAVSPVLMSVSAARAVTAFGTDLSFSNTGDAVTTSLGAALGLKGGDGTPPLDLSYSWQQTDESVPGDGLHSTTVNSPRAAFGFGTSAFTLSGSYAGDLHDGTYVADRYDAHSVGFSARMDVDGNELGLQSTSLLYQPPELVAGAFEQKTTGFNAYLSNLDPGGHRRRMSYQYAHTLVDTSATPLQEQARQSIAYEGDHLLTSPTLFARWLVNLAVDQVRSGTDETRSTGETAGVDVWWRKLSNRDRATTFEIHGGPRVALLQGEAGDTRGYGATGALRLRRPLAAYSLTADYTVNYGADAFASRGWRFDQTANASVEGRAGGARVHAWVRLFAFRTYVPLVGSGAGRLVEASASAAFPRYDLNARIRFDQGIAGATPGQFVGDGLLLPAPFNSYSLDVAAGAGAQIFTGLRAALGLRYSNRDVPGRPALDQVEGLATLTYRYASFGLSVEDRLTQFQNAKGWDTVNVVFVRVFRGFGW